METSIELPNSIDIKKVDLKKSLDATKSEIAQSAEIAALVQEQRQTSALQGSASFDNNSQVAKEFFHC